MQTIFEVELSKDYLEKIEADLAASVEALRSSEVFTDYNRGGGPAGDYDRHYDKSTGK